MANNHKTSIFGFTLAEVLITLVIIGIIAAVTVPAINQSTKKQEYVEKLKKTYSALSLATNQIIFEEGLPKGTEGGWATSSQKIFDLYSKSHLLNIKKCGTEEGCFTQKNFKQLNGTQESIDRDDASFHKLIMADGTQLGIRDEWVYPACDSNKYGTDNTCAMFMVDVNGVKPPNMIGRDIFLFSLNEEGLFPKGCQRNDCSKTSGSGWGCACKVIREGAMNY